MNSFKFWGQPLRRLIWIMPAAFVLHIVEEYRGGFPAWVTHVLGGSFNDIAFAFNNAAFLAIMVGLVVWASKSESRLAAFLLITWSSGNIFWDALFHVLTTAWFNRYSPGLIAARGGKQAKSKAVVAVARKLAVLLHRLWSTQEPYMPFYEQAA